jgi:23S rRNA pseudouridine2457 synthase
LTTKKNLILLNKPFGVMSQFTGDQPNLSDFVADRGFYPAGRLDKDSEGLLLLTNNGGLQARIANPSFKMEKTYWVQVESDITDDAITQLESGVVLKDGLTKPAKATRLDCTLPARTPDIRKRKNISTSWIELIIKEGRNRQVRRMTAAVGFPTLRLFRYQIGPWKVDELKPGETRAEVANLDR